ncbi:MAG: acylphosphatase [Acidobacteriaceae bacterium]
MTETPIHVHRYTVKGRVQGVGFRWYVLREASALGLRGWVRNTDAGHVELIAAGNAEQLQDLHVRLKSGSRGSRVDRIEQEERPAVEAANLQAFEIEGAW